MIAIVYISPHRTDCTALHFDRNKAADLSKSVNILLTQIISPVRVNALVCWDTETSLLFANTFRGDELADRPKVLGIFADNIKHFPFHINDEHHEMIIIDVNCGEGLDAFIEQVNIDYYNVS